MCLMTAKECDVTVIAANRYRIAATGLAVITFIIPF